MYKCEQNHQTGCDPQGSGDGREEAISYELGEFHIKRSKEKQKCVFLEAKGGKY